MIRVFVFLTLIISCIAEKENRFDCLPELNPEQIRNDSRSECIKRKCIWTEEPPPTSPRCYYNQTDKFGFIYQTFNTDGYKTKVTLKQTEPVNGTFPYPAPFKYPSVLFEKQSINRLRVKIYDDKTSRYEVPITVPSLTQFPEDQSNYDFQFVKSQNDLFTFKIYGLRKGKNVTLWDTNAGSMMLSDQFLQVSAKLPSEYLYGIGETSRPSFKRDFTSWTKIPLFSRDHVPYDRPNLNLYGTHPFYMILEEDGQAHGVLLLNSNAMDITTQPGPSITYRTIGGILDFYFFLGPTPEDVVQQYTEFVGRPVFPAYWALGFQLCRYGYDSLDEVKRTVDRMSKYDIPQDVQYGDIDYMERQLDFTYNKKTYDGLPQYIKDIKEKGIKYITILDPAISAEEPKGTYETYDLGSELGIWIKDESGKAPLIGKVWPDKPNIFVNKTWPWDDQTKAFRANATFPDWFHQDISKWWNVLIKKFHKTIEFDGLWIDMNEPANFVIGSVEGCSKNNLDYPPYKPNTLGALLAEKTLCMSALHADKQTEYNYHSLFGWKQSVVTLDALTETTNKRGIVISRSTFPSSGRYAGHWLGDNLSAWPQMKESIIGMLDFSLFGISYIGADICGFNDNTTRSLCLRWTQLGAFYPMSRNHNGLGYMAQDPAAFDAEFAKIAREILHVRYELLPFLYTLMYKAHVDGSTVVRPMFHVFPYDRNTWSVDSQFFWGSSLLITPILEENSVKVNAYFPNEARWFDYFTFEEMSSGPQSLHIPIDKIGLHIKGGSIIPMQGAANNTKFSRRKPMKLLVVYDKSFKAEGGLFWDDGESLNSVTEKKFLYLKFSANRDTLNISVANKYKNDDNLHFEQIALVGLQRSIKYVYVNETLHQSFTSKTIKNSEIWLISNVNLKIDRDYNIKWTSNIKSSSCCFKINIYCMITVIVALFAIMY